MQFNTYSFALFFICFLIVYHLSRKKIRLQNITLLLASYVFYSVWDPRFLFILIVPTVLDYLFAKTIQHGHVGTGLRLKLSGILILSFFVLVFVRHEAFSLHISSFPDCFTVDWPNIINSYGWKLLALILIVLCLINILFPVTRKWDHRRRSKLFVTLSIIFSLSLLGFFKYFNFFTESFILLAKNLFGITGDPNILKILLPIGISFYIFKTISYVVDVYRSNIKCSESLLDFAVYLAFFPQLLAGPIDRAGNLLPQIQNPRPGLTFGSVREGVWLFMWGLFKKVVVADNIAIIVNEIFGPYNIPVSPVVIPEDGLRMLVGIYAFTIQIYADFSGYTDMSRGIARLLGFNTMLNFNLPYFSITPGVFWRRWHISLSTWLRDYLYIPLGGNRCSELKIYRNTMITMLLGGLWHGASWTFVLWGGYHGILMVIFRFLGIEKNHKEYILWKKVITGFITFNLIAFGWLLFRSENITTVMVFIKSIFLSPSGSIEAWEYFISILNFSWFLVLFQIIQAWTKKLDPLSIYNWFVRLNVWIYLIFALMMITPVKKPEFIYFAF